MIAQTQFNVSMANSDYWNQVNFDESVRQYNEELAESQRQFNETMAYNKEQAAISQSNWEKEYNLSLASNNAKVDTKTGKVTVDNTPTYKEATEAQKKKALEAYNEGGEAALNQYVDSLPSNIDIEGIDSYVNEYGQLPLEQRTYTKTKDTTNWLWGVDNNDVVKDQYGNTYKIKDLPKSIQSALTKLKKGESYTKK